VRNPGVVRVLASGPTRPPRGYDWTSGVSAGGTGNKIKDVRTRHVECIGPDDTIPAAARTMRDRDVDDREQAGQVLEEVSEPAQPKR
jgi:hypothetical protein